VRCLGDINPTAVAFDGAHGTSVAFGVAFDGFKISDRGSTLAFLANGKRHVQQGVFEVVPRFPVEKRLRASEVFKKIFVSPDNPGIPRSSQRGKGMVVDIRWIQRRRGRARERHIDVLEIRAGIGLLRIDLGRANAVAGRSAGRPSQHPSTSRFICEDTESPLTATNGNHQKRREEQSQSQEPSRCASELHRPPPGLNELSGFLLTSLDVRREATPQVNSSPSQRINSSLLCATARGRR